jgi:hypothetical protein
LEYCLAGRIPESSEEQNSYGPGDKRVGMVLISPKVDALWGGHALYCSVNKFHFVIFQLKCGVGLFRPIPWTDKTKLMFPFHNSFACHQKMTLHCH